MGKTVNFLAIDFGAESGRGVLGSFDGERLSLEEIHRFPNGPVSILGSLYWDFPRLCGEMKKCISAAAQKAGGALDGIGTDTWGVDFGLVGRGDVILGNPYHYRDKRTDGMMDEAFRRLPREEIFEHTGIQFIKLNTIYQLLAMVLEKSPLLDVAETLLNMPDLFNFVLTGRRVSEFTIASTAQLYDPRKQAWSEYVFEKLGLPLKIMAEVIQPGTVVGELLPSVAEECGTGRIDVITPGGHDTACAVAAVPTSTERYAYISSGTWSLMGAEIREPIINSKALEYNFTNEGGVCGTFRFLKNIMGLWLVQECRRAWEKDGQSFSYAELTEMAEKAKPFVSIVEPDYEPFMGIGDMPGMIADFCRKTGQPVPAEKGAFVRCALESLALKYRWTLEKLEEVMGHKCEVIHVVGGGTQNTLLCRLTADAANLPVLAGPIEATAMGNVMMQALARGHVSSISEAREVIRKSFDVVTYEPRHTPEWDDAYARFLEIAEKAQA